MQTQPLKKWRLLINGQIRAHSIILPAEYNQLAVIEHIVATHKNAHRWPTDTDEREVRVDLKFEYVKPIYVTDAKMNRETKTENKKEFCKTSFTYTVVKSYK